MAPASTIDNEPGAGAGRDHGAAAEIPRGSRSLLKAAAAGYAISLALFIVPLVHFVAIPAAPAIGSIIASNMLGDSRRRRLALALVLTLLWELPVAVFAALKASGVGFVAGWPDVAIAGMAVGVAIWAFLLSLAGSLVAERVQSYATRRWRVRRKTAIAEDGEPEGRIGD